MNPIVHFEILAGPNDDKKALQAFYRDTFKWDIDANNSLDYGMVTPDDEDDGIGGAVDAAEDHAKVVIYLAVDDITYYLQKVKAAGCTVVKDITVVPDMVTYAIFRDPAGNEIGLVLDDGAIDEDDDEDDDDED
ncbi:MAG: VOC family protein [Chloroflexi bacterium]|nr:VOC family protein [Chloroflexota bacterium]